MTCALILAAGLGERLRPISSRPKWLVPVGVTSPMREQMMAIEMCVGVDRVVVITNGDDSEIREAVSPHVPQVDIDLVKNPHAEQWNNWSSAVLGFEHIGAGDHIVLLNSDLFASSRWLQAGLDSLGQQPTPALLVDTVRSLTDEAMKVSGRHQVTGIGKTGVVDPCGEYVGMAWWPAGTTGSITEILAAYRHKADSANNWYEHAILADIARGTEYRCVATPSTDWVEIDDPADHADALALTAATKRP